MPKTPRVIECASCGAPFKTKQPNTKRCGLCQMDRELTFIRARTKDCPRCGKEFALLTTKDYVCPTCDHRRVDNAEIGHCACCHQDGPLHRYIRICLTCMGDPFHRDDVLGFVARKANQNRAKTAKGEWDAVTL